MALVLKVANGFRVNLLSPSICCVLLMIILHECIERDHASMWIYVLFRGDNQSIFITTSPEHFQTSILEIELREPIRMLIAELLSFKS